MQKEEADVFFFFLFFKDLRNFSVQSSQLFYIGLNRLCWDYSVPNLIFPRASFDSSFEHFTIGLSDKSDRAKSKHEGECKQRDGTSSPSSFARTRRSADTVEVLGKLGGHVIVDDCFNTFDIETTRGQVCCHEIVYSTLTK